MGGGKGDRSSGLRRAKWGFISNQVGDLGGFVGHLVGVLGCLVVGIVGVGR